MEMILRVIYLLYYIKLADFTDPSCVIELDCSECIPDNMPFITSHRVVNGFVTAAPGDELVLGCFGGKFLAYPLRETVTALCESGRYRVRHDGVLRHLLELGCQENIFEDVLHEVEYCGAPLQGRAYQMSEWSGGGGGGGGGGGARVRHVATLCYDADRALAARARVTNARDNRLPLPAHAHRTAPLSLLGNFNHMFDAKTRADADRLYSDDVRTNRRLRELFKHERFAFADQTLTAGELLSGRYFDEQNVRVTAFASNKLAVWRSVASGNLRHVQRDVAELMRVTRAHAAHDAHDALDVYAGTHSVLALRSAHSRTEVFLKPERRFPVPKYIWTVVHDKRSERALAIVLVNDPFVAVSEIAETVFCESVCSKVSWLHELRRNRNYETPIYGLVFCCSVHNFTEIVTEMPRDIVKHVSTGNAGMLTEFSI